MMNMGKKIAGILLAAGMLVLLACAPKTAPSTASLPAKIVPVAPAEPNGQTELEGILSKAKMEGKVTLYISSPPSVKSEIGKVFKDKYGIELEMTTSVGAASVTKILRERAAGIYNDDLSIGGILYFLTVLKPEGVIESINSEIIDPNIKDTKLWYNGRLPFVDKDELLFTMVLSPGTGTILVNKDIVGKNEMSSAKDLLQPKWKGKIVAYDPTIGGAAQNLLSVIGAGPLGYDFIQELIKQDPTITRDERQMVEWVARGKFYVAVGARTPLVQEFQNTGAPILQISLPETRFLTEGGSCVVLFKKAPHPYARKIFINWLLSKEGQTVWSRATGVPSARIDVPTDHLLNHEIRQPGVQYLDVTNEEWQLTREPKIAKLKELFAPLLK